MIERGGYVAVVTEVGAALRNYEVDGLPLCLGFGADELPTGSRGQVLAPWPNRLSGGRYEFAGRSGRAAVDGAAGEYAMHGLVRWQPWRLEGRRQDAVELSLVLYPQPAYPFCLALGIEDRLEDRGLVVTTRATNEGEVAAPFGLGFHSYFHAGSAGVDGCCLELPARSHVLFDEQYLPRGRQGVDKSRFAGLAVHGSGLALGATAINDCFSDLEADDGCWHARLILPQERFDLELWAEAAFAYAMVYSGDHMEAPLRRRGIAVEPMTCAPNALRSGQDLIVLDPGASFAATWGMRPAASTSAT